MQRIVNANFSCFVWKINQLRILAHLIAGFPVDKVYNISIYGH